MLEASLYPLLVDGAIEEGWHLFRITDGSPGRKPFDIAGADPSGRAVGLEVKVVRSPLHLDQPIPERLFERQQIAWLNLYARAGAIALVGLYREAAGEMGIYQIKRRAGFERPAGALFKGALLRVDREYRGWTAVAQKIGSSRG